MKARKQVLVGDIYNRLTVFELAFKKYYIKYWLCKCECGNMAVLNSYVLHSGHTRSCGCLRKELLTTHGLHLHPIRGVYERAKSRCKNKTDPRWHRYGGRGIEFRLGTFEEFAKRMLPSWVKGLTLERNDNNGHYEYDNIRWATQKEQASNRSTNIKLTFQGETLIQAEWARVLGISSKALEWRLKHWSLEKALSTKRKESK